MTALRKLTAANQKILNLARDVLAIEARAVEDLTAHIDENFIAAHQLMLKCRGRIVVSGMGKSGHIANKIASTLSSTGTPSFFMHPGEAGHGDLGMIAPDDVLLVLSNSGESDELLAIVPLLKRRGSKLISMTGNRNSSLAREADVHLYAGVEKEACPLNLAPTASTTAALALGDALAVTLLDARGFSADDFARTHPGGALGRKLLVHVSDIMHSGAELPVVPQGATLSDALLEMTQKGLGMTAVVDRNRKLVGIFTDGDLRRTLEKPVDIKQISILDVMGKRPKTIRAGRLAAEAAQLMQQYKILSMLVTDEEGRLEGAFTMHDLLRAGVV
ncbi:MAG: KpsF/GutQ family sugar-phosphate isomerase [Burkholderiales bacterium]